MCVWFVLGSKFLRSVSLLPLRLFAGFLVVPWPVLAEIECPAYVAKLDDDLKLLLARFDVEEDVMELLGKYNTVTEHCDGEQVLQARTGDSFRDWCVKM